MQKAVWFTTALLLIAGITLALPPAKQAELQAAGVSNWTPGQHRGSGPVFKRLANPRTVNSTTGTTTGTCQYDDGTLSALPIIFGQVYGNKFNQGIGGVDLDTLTLNSFFFFFMEDSVPDTGMFFQPAAALNTMSINAIASTNITGLMNSGANFSAPVLNMVDASLLGSTMATMFVDTFYLGAWCLNTATMFPINNEVIGLATNAPNKGYTAVSGTGPVLFSNQPFNAMIRANITAQGPVPVELMAFEVK